MPSVEEEEEDDNEPFCGDMVVLLGLRSQSERVKTNVAGSGVDTLYCR